MASALGNVPCAKINAIEGSKNEKQFYRRQQRRRWKIDKTTRSYRFGQITDGELLDGSHRSLAQWYNDAKINDGLIEQLNRFKVTVQDTRWTQFGWTRAITCQGNISNRQENFYPRACSLEIGGEWEFIGCPEGKRILISLHAQTSIWRRSETKQYMCRGDRLWSNAKRNAWSIFSRDEKQFMVTRALHSFHFICSE